jgi:HEAT repeat protein
MGFLEPEDPKDLAAKKDVQGLIRLVCACQESRYEDYLRQAKEVLVEIGDSGVITAIVRCLVRNPTGPGVADLIAVLLKLGDAAVEPFIAGLVKSHFILGTSMHAVVLNKLAKNTLKEIGNAAIGPLIQVMKDDRHYKIRQFAVETLGMIPDARLHIDCIWNVLKDEPYWISQAWIGRMMADTGDAKYFEPLVRLIDTVPGVAIDGLKKIGMIGDERVIEPIIKKVERMKWLERRAGMQVGFEQVLVGIGKPAEAYLKKALSSKKKHVRKFAEKVLGEISVLASRPICRGGRDGN